jgi:hypothetical protein
MAFSPSLVSGLIECFCLFYEFHCVSITLLTKFSTHDSYCIRLAILTTHIPDYTSISTNSVQLLARSLSLKKRIYETRRKKKTPLAQSTTSRGEQQKCQRMLIFIVVHTSLVRSSRKKRKMLYTGHKIVVQYMSLKKKKVSAKMRLALENKQTERKTSQFRNPCV